MTTVNNVYRIVNGSDEFVVFAENIGPAIECWRNHYDMDKWVEPYSVTKLHSNVPVAGFRNKKDS